MTPLFMLVTTAWLAGADAPPVVIPQAESSSQSGAVSQSDWKVAPESEWKEEGNAQTDTGWKDVPADSISEAGWEEVPGSQTDTGWKEVPGSQAGSRWKDEEPESHHPILDRLRSLFPWGSKHENSSGVSGTPYKTTGNWVETTATGSSTGTRIRPVPTTPTSAGSAAGNFYDPEMETAEPPK